MFRARFHRSMLAIALVIASLGIAASASAQRARPYDEKWLPGDQYLTMQPFIIPVMKGGKHRQQLTIVIAMEFVDSNDREEVQRRVASFRDPMYALLIRMVSFRSAKSRIPSKETLQIALAKVVEEVGSELVKSVVVHKIVLGSVH